MNKILKNLIPVIVIGAIAVFAGFTLSYFSDTEKSENNIFSAGTLDFDLKKSGGGEANAVWQADNWMPGDEIEGELEIENKGSLPIESLLMEVEIVD